MIIALISSICDLLLIRSIILEDESHLLELGRHDSKGELEFRMHISLMHFILMCYYVTKILFFLNLECIQRLLNMCCLELAATHVKHRGFDTIDHTHAQPVVFETADLTHVKP